MADDDLRIIGLVNAPPPKIPGGAEYFANVSITNEMVESLSADKLETGIINADKITIATDDNLVTLNKDGLKIMKTVDPDVNIEFNANEPNGRIAVFRKGAIYIEDGDESVLIDTDGISADGIVRGILPGAINPIINSSFEKTDDVIPPTDWKPNTDAEWNDVTPPYPLRDDLVACTVAADTVQLTDPPSAATTVEDDSGDLAYTGSWSQENDANHSATHAKIAYRKYAELASDNFNRGNGGIGSSWLDWLATAGYYKANSPIVSNQLKSVAGTYKAHGGLYNRLFTSAELDSSYVIMKIYSNDWVNCAGGIGRRYNDQDSSYWTTSFWVGDGTMTLNNGNQSIKATGSLALANATWYWLRLQYDHDRVTAYTSPDGSTWTKQMSILVPGLGNRTSKVGFFGNVFNNKLLYYDDFSVTSTYGETQPYVDYTIPAGNRGCDIFTKKGPNQGNMHVIVDSVEVLSSPFDNFESAVDWETSVYHIKGLSPLTSHTLRIQGDYWINPSTSDPQFARVTLDNLLVSGDGYITMHHDLTQPPDDWSFIHSTVQPGDTGIITQFRSSADDAAWSDWTTNFEVVPLQQYIQIREHLTSYDGAANPTLISFTLGYQAEGTPIISDWIATGTNAAKIVSSQAAFKFGSKSFYCDNSLAPTDARAHQEVVVKPNTDYVLSCYYESQDLSANGATVRVYKPSANGGALLATIGSIVGTTQIWTRDTSAVFNTDDCETVIVQVDVGEVGDETSGELWLDAPMLHEDGVVTPWGLSLYDWIQHAHTGGAGSQIDHGELGGLADNDHPQYHTDQAYPIGSLYFNADVDTNPASLLGFGTWTLFAAGQVLVSPNGGTLGGESCDLGDTGGLEGVSLVKANLPSDSTSAGTAHGHTQNSHGHTQNSHNHTQSSHTHAQNSHDHPQGSHQHASLIYNPNGKYLSLNSGGSMYRLGFATNGSNVNECRTNYQVCAAVGGRIAGNVAQTASNVGQTATNQGTTATNQTESAHTHPYGGSDTAHQNCQPWVAVSIWKRTA